MAFTRALNCAKLLAGFSKGVLVSPQADLLAAMQALEIARVLAQSAQRAEAVINVAEELRDRVREDMEAAEITAIISAASAARIVPKEASPAERRERSLEARGLRSCDCTNKNSGMLNVWRPGVRQNGARVRMTEGQSSRGILVKI
jgi:hypothetical protein